MGTHTEFTNYYAPDGDIYYFDTHVDKFLISQSGFGMPPINYLTQRGPFQHGETPYDYRLEPRIIQLVHRMTSCGRDEYWSKRANLLNLIRPNRSAAGTFNKGTLRRRLSDGTLRDIDVVLDQGPVFEARNANEWDEWANTETIRWIAHDPTFYDPTQNTEVWVLNPDTRDELEFPFTFDGTDLAFRQYLMTDDHAITYTGTWPSYPSIVITGPLERPRITNTSTDVQIFLEYTVEDGETVTITLEYGNNSVVSSLRDNIMGTVTSPTSDLVMFYLAPDPEVAGGVNTVNVAGGNATGSTDVTLTYFTRYIGI